MRCGTLRRDAPTCPRPRRCRAPGVRRRRAPPAALRRSSRFLSFVRVSHVQADARCCSTVAVQHEAPCQLAAPPSCSASCASSLVPSSRALCQHGACTSYGQYGSRPTTVTGMACVPKNGTLSHFPGTFPRLVFHYKTMFETGSDELMELASDLATYFGHESGSQSRRGCVSLPSWWHAGTAKCQI